MTAFRNCKWCHGVGCMYCNDEREKANEEAMKPIFTADLNNPHDMELLTRCVGREAIEKAFEPGVSVFDQALGRGGGGMQEIERNAAIASFLQSLHKSERAETRSEQLREKTQ